MSPDPTVIIPRVRYSPASETIATEVPPAVSESNPGTTTAGSVIYHDIDPSSVSNLINPTSESCGRGRTDTLRSDHTYQYIEAGMIGTESNNIYKDPNRSNYGVSVCDNITC